MDDRVDDPGDDRPWWASGADAPDPDEDPLARHREARAGGRGTAGSSDSFGSSDGGRGRGDGAGQRRSSAGAGWWEAYDAIGRLAREVGGARAGAGHGQTGEVCHLCPICTGLRLLEEVRPEVVAHLTEAARHLTLAAKAVVDAQADQFAGDGGLQHIDLDDE